MTERDRKARELYDKERSKILERIRKGECSASMSGIEYYPPWDENADWIKDAYREKARKHA